MEPWLIEFQRVRYNLAESGVADDSLDQVFTRVGRDPKDLLTLSLGNGDTRGSVELRKSIAALYDNVEPDSVLVTTGVSEALLIYFHMRYRPGANVVVPWPAFQSLYELPRYLGYEVRFLRLRREAGFRPDPEELARLVDDHTTAIVVNNPHNPTGVLLTKDEISSIIGIAERHSAEILADEHYRFIPYDGDGLVPSLYGRSHAVIGVGSVIKCAGCVGLRVGWMLGEGEFLRQCRDFKDYTTHTISPLSDYIANVVLADWRTATRKYRSWILENIAVFRAMAAANANAVEWIEPQAGIVAFPFLKNHGGVTERFARLLAENEGVSILPGEVFQMPGHFRIGFGIAPDLYKAAIARLEKHLQSRGCRA